MYKLAIFDFDSTLMDGETIEFIADEIGLRPQIAEITERAMQGEIDFFESLTQRVSLLKGIKESRVNEICAELPLMNGAKETVSALQKSGMTVICFSGGFRNALIPAQKKLGFDGQFSNILHAKDGLLTGLVGGEMMFSDSKGQILQKLQGILRITPEQTIVVGDGANDLSMFAHAKERIAFCAKPILKREATTVIDEKDLTKILKTLDL